MDQRIESPLAAPAAPRKALHAGLWTVQVLLAALFGFAGVLKTTTPIEELARQMSYVSVMGEAGTRFIGISELAGALGLILPALTRIRPRLTALAAAGLLTVMVLAAGYHALHAEWSTIPLNIVLGALAAFVAWGRFRAVPILPRPESRS